MKFFSRRAEIARVSPCRCVRATVKKMTFRFLRDPSRSSRTPICAASDQPATMAEEKQDKGETMTVPKAKVRQET